MCSSRTPTRTTSRMRLPSASARAPRFVAITELANVLEEQGIEDAADANLGGTVTYDWGWVKLVQAFHTSTVPGSSRRPTARPQAP